VRLEGPSAKVERAAEQQEALHTTLFDAYERDLAFPTSQTVFNINEEWQVLRWDGVEPFTGPPPERHGGPGPNTPSRGQVRNRRRDRG
jgi:hypothetical protein